MNCPVCGSEIPAGAKYCSVCGTDVEGAQLRAQQAAPSPRVAPRGAEPQQSPQPQGRAVPMNPSMPPQAVGGRSFDTSKMNGSPKWPIVLICVLVVVIVAVVLLIFHPWSQGAEAPTSNVPATTEAETVTPVASEGDAQDAGEVSESQQTAAAGLSDADAYTQLSSIYGQFEGFNGRIQSLVDYFNTYFPDGADATSLQSQLDAARALQTELAAQTDQLNAIQLAEGSAYVDTLANLKTLNNDLVQRTADLADALQAWVDGASSDQIGSYLTRNNQNGSSVYKTEYESLYPNAAPQPLQ